MLVYCKGNNDRYIYLNSVELKEAMRGLFHADCFHCQSKAPLPFTLDIKYNDVSIRDFTDFRFLKKEDEIIGARLEIYHLGLEKLLAKGSLSDHKGFSHVDVINIDYFSQMPQDSQRRFEYLSACGAFGLDANLDLD